MVRLLLHPALLAAALLVVAAALLIDAAWQDSVTLDEYAHLPAGLTHWRDGTWSAYKVNPPLSKLWAAAPVLPLTGSIDLSAARGSDGEYGFLVLGAQLQEQAGDRYRTLYFVARLPNVLLALSGAVVAFVWSRQLYGSWGGLVTLALYCTCPNLLAHGHLVTPDIGASVSCLLASYVFWRYLCRPGLTAAAAAGAALGVAVLFKFSSLALYPAWLIAWLGWTVLRSPDPPRDSRPAAVATLGHAAVVVLMSLVVINAGYRFDGTGTRLGDFRFLSRDLTGSTDSGTPGGGDLNRFRGTALDRLPVPLPTQFVLGIDRQKVDFERGLYSYLCGEMRREGWYHYYLYALAVKTPVGTLVLLALACLLSARTSARAKDELVLLVPPAVVLVMVSSQIGFNHHLRYVLPCVPFLLVWCGRVGSPVGRVGPQLRKAYVCGVGLCLAWNAVSVWGNHPHHLSYFNEPAGGPADGHRHLSNSNVDWGQDLYALRDWLDAHPEARPLKLAYFGCVDPRPFGITFDLPPRGPIGRPEIDRPLAGDLGPQPGWYAVSVNFAHGLPFAVPDGRGGMVSAPPFAFAYFQRFRPTDRIGYSIWVYHVTPDEANAVRQEFGLPPVPVRDDPNNDRG